MGTHRKSPSKRKKKKGRTASPYPFALRLKVVRLYLEDGYPSSLVAEQFGISAYSVYRWGKLYREQGEQGLKARQRKSPAKSKRSAAVTQNIVKLKKENPGYGIRRISDVLKRFFFMPASPSTVQRTLRAQGLNTPVKMWFYNREWL